MVAEYNEGKLETVSLYTKYQLLCLKVASLPLLKMKKYLYLPLHINTIVIKLDYNSYYQKNKNAMLCFIVK